MPNRDDLDRRPTGPDTLPRPVAIAGWSMVAGAVGYFLGHAVAALLT